jgi:hypothetical protein
MIIASICIILRQRRPSNVRLTSEPLLGAKLARRSLEAGFVTTGESGSSACYAEKYIIDFILVFYHSQKPIQDS